MSKVYLIERRLYALDTGEAAQNDYRSVWGCKAYSSFDAAHDALLGIKNIKHLKHRYEKDAEDTRAYQGDRYWKELNTLEVFEIIGYELANQHKEA